MGSSVGAAARAGGAEVIWASEGRSAATRERASGDGLTEVATLASLVEVSDIVISVCPPHSAQDVANSVAALGFGGTYADLNAIAPASSREVAGIIEAGGGRYVDGGIVGPPARSPGTTRLYLSGPSAKSVAALFDGSLLGVVSLDGGLGAASALKMAYAAWTKGGAALLMAVRALAAAEGIEQDLVREWDLSQPGLSDRSADAVARTPEKAWRFSGEMREIAATFAAAGLPDGFHRAAEAVYERLSPLRDREHSFEEALLALCGTEGNN